MKLYFNLLPLFFTVAFSSCSNKIVNQSFHLPKVSSIDEKEEVFLQKKILINEMIDASKILHQISWPILKENIDICNNKDSYSLGILFATEKDLPERDSAFFRVLFNENINTYYLKKFNAMSFPIVISVAKNSPAYKATLNENDVILEINEQNVSNFRKKLKESLAQSSVTHFTILRNDKIIKKSIQGIKACNYNVQAIPAPSPNAFAD